MTCSRYLFLPDELSHISELSSPATRWCFLVTSGFMSAHQIQLSLRLIYPNPDTFTELSTNICSKKQVHHHLTGFFWNHRGVTGSAAGTARSTAWIFQDASWRVVIHPSLPLLGWAPTLRRRQVRAVFPAVFRGSRGSWLGSCGRWKTLENCTRLAVFPCFLLVYWCLMTTNDVFVDVWRVWKAAKLVEHRWCS